jgi:Protein of unknown function (DUF1501)
MFTTASKLRRQRDKSSLSCEAGMNREACPGRRRFLYGGANAVLSSLALAQLRAASAEPPPRSGKRPARHCILVYLLGGPPHVDMWDPKPTAPAEIRGPFDSISTSIPGVRFGEHLPRMAQRADRLAVVRSVSHDNNDHPFMIYYTLTGRVSPVPLGANTVLPPNRNDSPHMGSIVAKFAHANEKAPGYVAIPEVTVRMQPIPVSGGGRAGFLGPRYDPLPVNDDPTRPLTTLALPEGVSAARFQGRESLLAVLDGRTARCQTAIEYAATRRTALGLARSSSGGLFDVRPSRRRSATNTAAAGSGRACCYPAA